MKLAFFLNFGFALAEAAGGIWTNSVAILADALHDAGDSLSLGVAWLLQALSWKKANALFTYGYRRLSVLSALITGLVLLAGLVLIVWRAVPRLWNPPEVHAPAMIGFALLGIAVNGYAAWRFKHGASFNERMVSWHLLEDVLGWVAVLIGALVMSFWDLPVIDPLLSVLISLLVLWNVARNMKKVVLVFLQTAPESFDVQDFQQNARQIPKVISTHHTHSWSIDGDSHVLSTHLVMQSDASRDEIAAAKCRVRELLQDHHFEHVTVEVELEGEPCAASHATLN